MPYRPVIMGWRAAAEFFVAVLLLGTNGKLTHPDKMADIFAYDIFKRIYLNDNVWIFIDISLMFIRKGAIDNCPALV